MRRTLAILLAIILAIPNTTLVAANDKANYTVKYSYENGHLADRDYVNVVDKGKHFLRTLAPDLVDYKVLDYNAEVEVIDGLVIYTKVVPIDYVRTHIRYYDVLNSMEVSVQSLAHAPDVTTIAGSEFIVPDKYKVIGSTSIANTPVGYDDSVITIEVYSEGGVVPKEATLGITYVDGTSIVAEQNITVVTSSKIDVTKLNIPYGYQLKSAWTPVQVDKDSTMLVYVEKIIVPEVNPVITIEFVDENGNVVDTQTINATNGQTLNINDLKLPAKYKMKDTTWTMQAVSTTSVKVQLIKNLATTGSYTVNYLRKYDRQPLQLKDSMAYKLGEKIEIAFRSSFNGYNMASVTVNGLLHSSDASLKTIYLDAMEENYIIDILYEDVEKPTGKVATNLIYAIGTTITPKDVLSAFGDNSKDTLTFEFKTGYSVLDTSRVGVISDVVVITDRTGNTTEIPFTITIKNSSDIKKPISFMIEYYDYDRRTTVTTQSITDVKVGDRLTEKELTLPDGYELEETPFDMLIKESHENTTLVLDVTRIAGKGNLEITFSYIDYDTDREISTQKLKAYRGDILDKSDMKLPSRYTLKDSGATYEVRRDADIFKVYLISDSGISTDEEHTVYVTYRDENKVELSTQRILVKNKSTITSAQLKVPTGYKLAKVFETLTITKNTDLVLDVTKGITPPVVTPPVVTPPVVTPPGSGDSNLGTYALNYYVVKTSAGNIYKTLETQERVKIVGIAYTDTVRAPANYVIVETVNLRAGCNVVYVQSTNLQVANPDSNNVADIGVTGQANQKVILEIPDAVMLENSIGSLTVITNDSVIVNRTANTSHKAYIAGRNYTIFAPDENITRAEMATLLSTSLGGTKYTNPKSKTFNDVVSGAWYIRHIEFVSSTGLMIGFPDGSFKPDDLVTKAELAQISSKFQTYGQKEILVFNATDVPTTHWAKSVIEKLYTSGRFPWTTTQLYKPNSAATRAEVVALLNVLLDRVPVDLITKITFTDISGHAYEKDILEAAVNHTIE